MRNNGERVFTLGYIIIIVREGSSKGEIVFKKLRDSSAEHCAPKWESYRS